MRELFRPVKIGSPPAARDGRAILKVEASPERVKCGRRWVGDWLYDHLFAEESIYRAEVVVSELITNALRHGEMGSRPIEVRIYLDEGMRAVVEVIDASDREPVIRGEDLGSLDGRGLAMLDVLVRELGWVPLRGGGKSVWVVLDAVMEAESGCAGVVCRTRTVQRDV
ncbi:ATP-binding protein [Actinomadura parmotrematis]|uniref:ATP-binding protein n=1 Tax=Actinomadura parmotrematis TaxID=2864039 RepID=A0ABS7FUC4_9ACTN|nr:ATP-binding protein [Actinomadura parmotrematis]MBW8484010.1 ATP-binding protein [Actinomadura parmotrematis]